jgi:hypothetical protein
MKRKQIALEKRIGGLSEFPGDSTLLIKRRSRAEMDAEAHWATPGHGVFVFAQSKGQIAIIEM